MKRNPDRDQIIHDTVTTHRPQLTAFIRGLVQDRVEADDVVQDVFEEFIHAYDLGVTLEKAGSWLMTVARHKVFDRFRRKKTRLAFEETMVHATDQSSHDDDEWMRSWLRDDIIDALELLPIEQRQVFVMYELEGKSFKEIAAETKTPIGTLLARKKYAVDFLRTHLKEIYDEYE